MTYVRVLKNGWALTEGKGREGREQRLRGGEALVLLDKQEQCVMAGELGARWGEGNENRREGWEESTERPECTSMSWATRIQGGC